MRETTMEDKISKGTEVLKDSYKKLTEVADFCQNNYRESENTANALEQTLQYTTESLASVAYQINVLARDFLEVLDTQAVKMKDIETKVSHLDMRVQIHRERVARRAIGQYTTSKPTCHLSETRQPGIIYPDHMEKPGKYMRKPIDYSILDHLGHGVRVQEPQIMVTPNSNPQPRRSSGSESGSAIYDTAAAPSHSSRSSTLSHQSGAEYSRYAASMHAGGTATLGRTGGGRVASVAQQPSAMALGGHYAPTGSNLVSGTGTTRRGSGSTMQYATPTVPRNASGQPGQPPTGIAQPMSQQQMQQQQMQQQQMQQQQMQQQQMQQQQMQQQQMQQQQMQQQQMQHQQMLQQQQHQQMLQQQQQLKQQQLQMAPAMGMPTAMTGAAQVHYQETSSAGPTSLERRKRADSLQPRQDPAPTVQVDERRKASLPASNQMPAPPSAGYASSGLTSTPPPPPPLSAAATTPAPPPPVFDSHEGTPQLPPPPVLETSTIDLDTIYQQWKCFSRPSDPPFYHDSPPPPPPPPEAFGNAGGHLGHLPASAHHHHEAELPPPPMGLGGHELNSRHRDAPDGYQGGEMPPAPPLGAVEDPMTGEMNNYRAKASHDPAWAPAYYLSKVITLYEYVQDKDDELTFGENQIIFVVKKNDDGWWEGVMNGLTGLFPGNYVEPCD